jgi:enoyl-[acyl-carrier protein] reductase I
MEVAHSAGSILQPQILKGKKGLIMGVANDKSIAWGIAESMAQHGAKLAFTYQNEMLLKRLEPLAKSIDSENLYECNVADMDSLDRCFDSISKDFGNIDFVIHSIAFSDKNELRGRLVDTSLDNFLNSMNISCFSLIAIAKRAEVLLNEGGSITTLTYYGAEKAIPNYNVMGIAKSALECSVKYLANDMGPKGIRVNAISAGPIKTLAASGIGDFRSMLKMSEQVSPLRRNTSLQDVAGCAVYLSSYLSSGTTGEIIHVDSGYHTVGMFAANISENTNE